jgi:FkbM family methyltransferase
VSEPLGPPLGLPLGARLTSLSSRVRSLVERDGDTRGPGGHASRGLPFPPALAGGAYELVTTDAGDFWMSATDEVMRPYMQRRGAWEESERDLLGRLIRPGTRFLDVGANVGYFSVFAAKAASGVEVDSVEPHPEIVPMLRMNLWANQVRARVWPVALDSKTTVLPIASAPMNPGDSRVARPLQHNHYDMVVPAIPADELFRGRTFDLVKIDVQGWEWDVVLGMQRILRESRDIVLVVEFFPAGVRDAGDDPYDLLRRYRALGFDIVVQRDESLGRAADREIVELCDTGGPSGQVNLMLTRS